MQVAGRAEVWPVGHFWGYYHLPEYFTEDEIAEEVLRRDIKNEEISAAVSKAFGLDKWLVVNQVAPLSITEWIGSNAWTREHGLHRLVQEALLYEATKILDERKREIMKSKQDQKLADLQDKGNLAPIAHKSGGIAPYLQ